MRNKRRGEAGETVSGINILLIEDQEQDRFLVGKLLEKQAPTNQEYSLEWCASLLDGIEFIKDPAHDIHCVLLDLNLPDARGLDVLLRIKKVNPHIPIIIMTGLEDEKTLEAAVRFGAHSYIVKKDIARSANIWERIIEAVFSANTGAATYTDVPKRECHFGVDAKLNVATWDESCELLTSWPADRVLGKPLKSLSVTGFQADIQEALTRPHAHLNKPIEFDLVGTDGELRRLALSAVADFSGDAKQTVWRFALPADELASNIASQVVNAVVRLSEEMLLIFDTDGRIHRCSETAARLLGAKRTEIVGSQIREMTDISSSNHSRVLLRSIRQGQSYAEDRYAFTGSGEYPLIFRLKATPLRDNFGGLIGGCLIAHPLPQQGEPTAASVAL